MGDDIDDGGSHGLAVHAVVFVAVNLLLIGIWAMFTPTGSFDQVPELLAHPSQARAAGFFPIYVMMFWGAGLLIHAGIHVVTAPSRHRKRRARNRARRELQSNLVSTLGDNLLGDAAVAGIRMVDGDKAAKQVKKSAAKKSKKATKNKGKSKKATKKSASGARSGHQGARDPRASGDEIDLDRRDGAERRSPDRVPDTPGIDADLDAGAGDAARTTFGRRATDHQGARHWVAVMFTDIVDSTPLNESLGDEQWANLLVAHRGHVRQCIGNHRGIEVGTQGDGFLVRFETPDDAAACAIALQRQLAAERLERASTNGDGTLHIRIGIHAGEVVHNDDDLVGRVINLASRVTSAAAADEILVTEPLADHLSPGHALVDRGLKTLKGFEQPRHVLALAWQEEADVIQL